MGKDTISNVLYVLGVIGSILYVITAAYLLATHFIVLPDYTFIFDWVSIVGLILFALAFFGIYRDSDSFIPIFAMILFFIPAIIAALGSLNILGPLILTLPDPITAELAIIWAMWIIWIIAFLLAGYSVWMTREQIGSFATIAAIIFMIWGFIRFALRFLDYGLGPSIYDQLWFAGTIIIYLIACIYFILAIRE